MTELEVRNELELTLEKLKDAPNFGPKACTWSYYKGHFDALCQVLRLIQES